jgi:hypothetical protein
MKLKHAARKGMEEDYMVFILQEALPLAWGHWEKGGIQMPVPALKAGLSFFNILLFNVQVQIHRMAKPGVPVQFMREDRSLQGHHGNPSVIERSQHLGQEHALLNRPNLASITEVMQLLLNWLRKCYSRHSTECGPTQPRYLMTV